MRAARVELTKWPAQPHRCVDGVLLGEDRYGVWIGNPTGSRLDYAGGRRTTSARVFVLPRNAWWHGRHFTDGGWKLDITTIPQWRGEHATMADLDLDVLRNDGRAWIEDEDEFAESLRTGVMPSHFAEPARTTATRLLHALQADEEPFASVGDHWLARLQEIEHTVVATQAPAPTAVIFDMGGVLERITSRTARAGWESRLGLPTGELDRRMADAIGPGWAGGRSEAEIRARLAANLGLNSDSVTAVSDAFAADTSLEPELAEFIGRIRPRHPVAVLANAGPTARATWVRQHRLDQLVDAIVVSAEERLSKPDPRSYRTAARRLGVSPDACVFIDDRLENVIGAAGVGMYPVRHTSAADTVAILRRVLSPRGMLGQKRPGLPYPT
jgi:HAD superfamily hydrolase (TIGR01509 family)